MGVRRGSNQAGPGGGLLCDRPRGMKPPNNLMIVREDPHMSPEAWTAPRLQPHRKRRSQGPQQAGQGVLQTVSSGCLGWPVHGFATLQEEIYTRSIVHGGGGVGGNTTAWI